MLRHVALVKTDVSEELSALFLRSLRRLLVTACVVPSSPILVTLMKEALSSSETSVLTWATQRNFPDDAILLSRNGCIPPITAHKSAYRSLRARNRYVTHVSATSVLYCIVRRVRSSLSYFSTLTVLDSVRHWGNDSLFPKYLLYVWTRSAVIVMGSLFSNINVRGLEAAYCISQSLLCIQIVKISHGI
jgi:hypothetical protein